MRVEIEEAADRLDELVDAIESGRVAEIVLTRDGAPAVRLIGPRERDAPAAG